MHLIDFMNSNPTWWEWIQDEPYCVEVKADGPYFLLKYNQLESDFSLTEVCECRGTIVRYDKDFKAWRIVCAPFKKFFNRGETNAAAIDWKSAMWTPKIDGSLMKVWWDDEWHLSTNGTIDAFKAPVGDTGDTFGGIFERCLGQNFKTWAADLDIHTTYLFEMTSPETRVVIPYDDGIYYLAAFDNDSWVEVTEINDWYIHEPIHKRKPVAIDSIAVLNDMVDAMSKDEEGVVVEDKYGNRVKIKSPAYLAMAHIWNNGGALSKVNITEMILNHTIDDFVAYFPYAKTFVDKIHDDMIKFADALEMQVNEVYLETFVTQKEFAMRVKDFPNRDWMFRWHKNDENCQRYDAWDWMEEIGAKKVVERMEAFKNGAR